MSEIADAIHADAEAARAEIREAGIVCPSCGVNMADLPRDHVLTITSGRSYEGGPGGAVVLAREPQTAKCAAGQAIELADSTGTPTVDFETFKAAMNISVWDTCNRAVAAEILGEP